MSPVVIVTIIVIALACVGLLLLVLYGSGYMGGQSQNNSGSVDRLRILVSAQRQRDSAKGKPGEALLVNHKYEEQQTEKRKSGSVFKLDLERKIWYAKWRIRPIHFRIIQFSIVAFVMFVGFVLPPKLMSYGIAADAGLLGFVAANAVLERAMRKRSDAFDQDYPVMLMQFVSLLKTGMSPITALDNVAKSLEPSSLVRQELEILVERLRLGLTEEQALGAFAEDIFHPEVELFIQALILNMKVGGKLSGALERLAKQVRKRQEFKKKAIAAVGMERGSIWAILGIMIGLFVFLWISEPTLIEGLFIHPVGQTVFPWTVMLILIGMLWSRKITNVVI